MNETWALAAAVVVGVVLVGSSPAVAQPAPEELPSPPAESTLHLARRTATDILTQPIRDAGLMGGDIPDPLVRATIDPYDFQEDESCEQVRSEIVELSRFLGSDAAAGAEVRGGRVAKLAEAGGRAAVNSLVPFRLVVREVSGAAAAQRRYQEAVQFGFARRGFLRAVYRLQHCSAEPGDSSDAGGG